MPTKDFITQHVANLADADAIISVATAVAMSEEDGKEHISHEVKLKIAQDAIMDMCSESVFYRTVECVWPISNFRVLANFCRALAQNAA